MASWRIVQQLPEPEMAAEGEAPPAPALGEEAGEAVGPEGQFCIINDDDGSEAGCFDTREEAFAELADLVRADVAAAQEAGLEPEQFGGGRAFRGLLVVEGMETDDGRLFEMGALGARETPLPLMFQDRSLHGAPGDASAWFGGAISSIERDPREASRWLISGNLASGQRGLEAQQLIEDGLVYLSVDAFSDEVFYDVREVDASGFPIDILQRFQTGTILAGTVTPMQALPACIIWFADAEEPARVAQAAGQEIPRVEQPAMIDDGLPALIAAGGRSIEAPPAEWFANPCFGRNPDEDPRLGDSVGGGYGCHLTVTDEGQIFGHIATWDTPHLSFPGREVFAPRSTSRQPYGWFMRGQVVCADGSRVAAGPLTMETGHADTEGDLTAGQAQSHYDNTGTVVADIAVGEDQHGIWCAGALRQHLSEDQIRALIACDVSGDWRGVGRDVELVAVLCVNTPGFLVPRPRARVASGQVLALVAAAGPSWVSRSAPSLRRVAMADGGRMVVVSEARLGEMIAEQLEAAISEVRALAQPEEEKPSRVVIAPPARPDPTRAAPAPMSARRRRQLAEAQASAS